MCPLQDRKTVSIATQKFAHFFRLVMKKSKKRYKRRVRARQDILQIQSALWMAVRDAYLDNEAGVYIEGLGYLCHVIRPERRFISYKLNSGGIIRRMTDGYEYKHCVWWFRPRGEYFHLWLSDYTKALCRSRVREGVEYKLFYKEFYSINRLEKKRRNKIVLP